jgi:hypothetical protein
VCAGGLHSGQPQHPVGGVERQRGRGPVILGAAGRLRHRGHQHAGRAHRVEPIGDLPGRRLAEPKGRHQGADPDDGADHREHQPGRQRSNSEDGLVNKVEQHAVSPDDLGDGRRLHVALSVPSVIRTRR